MRVAVFTPTRLYGGADVGVASLMRQTHRPHAWLVADEMLDERRMIWGAVDAVADFDVVAHRCPKRAGMWNNLASSYNWAIEWAREHDVDLLVSVQDYFWLPDDGLERFARMAEVLPGQLYTGLASLAADPPASTVADRKGLYTVFVEPFIGDRPQEIAWADVRDHDQFEAENGYCLRTPIEWELNYAAIPRAVFEKLDFDLAYERGVAYDNHDYAMRAYRDLEAGVWLDRGNHAIGLPHKRYFPEVEARELAVNNQGFHEERWGL